ncbi:MAG: flavodoxin family protein [Methanobrevibacter sp.]|uniref:Flavodoxin family protein n=1 Tax=Methanobrevibacter millerae TaxID=230361 RepID=A0A8T3VNH6_9EURY|nr:flavodoxin family protein [Methanobrevibacter sp.]MBE6510881.1 flavodoxin family protein [Methanobrevibacter millerae]MBO5152546.1 flavodoxin family protein [Methanobrevibacter sp.]
MKVIALNGSPRKRGNSNRFLDEMIDACKSNGHEVKKYFLDKMDINPCSGCEICSKGKDCRFNDDGTEIIDQLAEGASLIVASPIYFGQMTAQLKTIIDRFYSIFNNPDKKFDGKVAVIFVHAYPGDDFYRPYVDSVLKQPFEMNTELEIVGSLEVGGVKFIGDADKAEEALKKAYEIGLKF